MASSHPLVLLFKMLRGADNFMTEFNELTGQRIDNPAYAGSVVARLRDEAYPHENSVCNRMVEAQKRVLLTYAVEGVNE